MSHVYSAISKVTREIGFLRNLDETLIFVRNDCSAGEFGGLIEKISRKRIREAARVHRHLKRLDADSMERSVYAAISKLSGNKAALLESGLIGFLSDRSINMFRDIHALLPSVQDEEAFEMRHALRIAIKHWRYFLEILAELTGKDYDAVLDDLKAYQTILGRLNDIAVFSSYAESWNMSATDRDLFESVAADARTSALAALAGIVFARPLRYSFL